MPDQARIEKALHDWRVWQPRPRQRPTLRGELGGGRTNRSFLLDDGEQLFVLRLNTLHSQALGISRQREAGIYRALPQSLVPQCLFIDNDILVTAFVEGRRWQAKDFCEARQQQRLAAVLQQIRSVKLPDYLPAFSYLQHLRHYLLQLDDRATTSLQQLEWAARQLDERAATSSVLCHHDLVPENIIETAQGLVVLDWEYAAMGHPEIDSLAIGNPISESEKETLVVWRDGINQLWEQLQNKLTGYKQEPVES